jgi:hypothetical protein
MIPRFQGLGIRIIPLRGNLLESLTKNYGVAIKALNTCGQQPWWYPLSMWLMGGQNDETDSGVGNSCAHNQRFKQSSY